MTDVETVRALVNDHPQWDSVTASGDGATVRYNLPYYPVVSGTYSVAVNGVTKTETTDYTLDGNLGLVTFVVAPANAAVVRIEYQHVVLSDADITVYLTECADDPKPHYRAAELWCNVVASQQVLLLKAGKLLDIEADGPAVATSLRELGKTFRDQVLRDRAMGTLI